MLIFVKTDHYTVMSHLKDSGTEPRVQVTKSVRDLIQHFQNSPSSDWIVGNLDEMQASGPPGYAPLRGPVAKLHTNILIKPFPCLMTTSYAMK